MPKPSVADVLGSMGPPEEGPDSMSDAEIKSMYVEELADLLGVEAGKASQLADIITKLSKLTDEAEDMDEEEAGGTPSLKAVLMGKR